MNGAFVTCMGNMRLSRLALAVWALGFPVGCALNSNVVLMPASDGRKSTPAESGCVGEREAPEVFFADEAGFWDGLQSHDGVWVAHPDAGSTERVAIRASETGRSVIGVLHHRDRSEAGPQLQVSSDVAEALGLSTGIPMRIQVVALSCATIASPSVTPAGALPAWDVQIEAIPSGEDDETAETTDRPDVSGEGETPNLPAGDTTSPVEARDIPANPDIQVGYYPLGGNGIRVAGQCDIPGLTAWVDDTGSGARLVRRVTIGQASSMDARSDGFARVADSHTAVDAFSVPG